MSPASPPQRRSTAHYRTAPISLDRRRLLCSAYAEQDDRVTATRDAAKTALEKAGLTHEIVTFPDAGHAFFNDTGQRYNPAAAASAYEQLIGWFNTHVG